MSEILFADDDAAMRLMVSDMLRAAGHRVRLASNGRSALEQVRKDPPDLVILDYHMGRPNGLEVCREIKGDPRLEHLPVLILTAQSAVDDRVRGFDAGADDYLPKPFDARELRARVGAMLRLSRQALDRNPTSGLPGGEAIRREFERRRERGRPFSVCYLDLDYFKPFGDHFGFAVADDMIREVGRLLTEETTGTGSFVGHIGGDDFILICSQEDARAQVEDLRARFPAALARHLPPEVVAAGRYRGVDRNGVEREFPLTRISAAIVHTDARRFNSLREVGEVVAATKGRAKRLEESGIAEIELLSGRGSAEGG